MKRKNENAPLTVAEMNAHSRRGGRTSALDAMKTPYSKKKKVAKGGGAAVRRMPDKRRSLLQ